MNNLKDKIQGIFDKQTVKNSLQSYFNSNSLGYLKKWIDESNESTVMKFVKAVTGSSTLGMNSNICIYELNSSERLPEYHTCSKQVDIPQYPDYATFKKKLEESFGCLDDEAFQLR